MSSTSQKTIAPAPDKAMPTALPSKPPFVPSGNWAALQKTLPTQPSKKRKRTAPIKTKPAPGKPHTPKPSQTLSTYNPWNPNASTPRANGNPSLIQHTNSPDKLKFFIGFECAANDRAGRYVGIDCEMVGVGPDGTEDILARVSLVNFYGNVLSDVYVVPMQRVTDWRTIHSGIRPADVLKNPEGKYKRYKKGGSHGSEIVRCCSKTSHGNNQGSDINRARFKGRLCSPENITSKGVYSRYMSI